MKKIKKAAVLVPAFATVVLATVGSVTGTMAWFTANRSATTTASVFESATLNTSLTITAADPYGVTVSGSTVTMSDNLTHGSYDAINDNLSVVQYGSNDGIDADGNVVTHQNFGAINHRGGYSLATDSNWLAGSKTVDSKTTKTYFGVRWTYTFEYDFGTIGANNVALMLDCANSHFAVKDTSDAVDSTGKTTGNGFRLGFKNGDVVHVLGTDISKKIAATEGETSASDYVAAKYTGGYYVKYKSGETDNTAPNAESTVANTLHGAGSDLDNVGFYDTKYEQIATGNSVLTGLQAETKYSAEKEYFGTLVCPTTGSTTKASVSYQVVAWFEGMDSSVVSSKEMARVAAGLKFYVVDIAK